MNAKKDIGFSSGKRQAKGYEIAQHGQIQQMKDGWLVRSQSGNGFYRVSDMFVCDCPDSELHNETCKHAYAVRYYLEIEKLKPEGIETDKVRLTYKQAWSAYNKAQTQEGRLFDVLLKDLTYSIQVRETPQRRGRPHLLARDQLFVIVKKLYLQMSSRRSISAFKASQDKGQISHTPHFNTVLLFLNNPKITPILHELIAITASPLREVETGFAVDSTGFRTTCFGAYCEGKYPTGRQHKWLKLHASCGVKTNIITAVRITEGEGADSPQLIPLTEETAKNGFDMQKVYADKGYIGKDNLERITELGAMPYIPFKSNTSGKSGGSTIWRKAYFYFKMNQDEFMQNYHQRSNIESTFAAMKKKLGEVLKSRLPVAQENELLCKVIAYNIMVLIQEMHELGIAVDFAPQ